MDTNMGFMDELAKHRGWLIAAGICYFVLGALAASLPIVSTVGITIYLGALFVVSGVIQFIHAMKLRHQEGNLTRFVQSLFAVVAGALIFFRPEIGMLGISLTMGIYFFVVAAMQMATSQTSSGARFRFWRYLSAGTFVALGLYILFTFPISAFWIPGMLFGIALMCEGVGLIGMALEIHKPATTKERNLDYAIRTN